jgi:hypothetical protein
MDSEEIILFDNKLKNNNSYGIFSFVEKKSNSNYITDRFISIYHYPTKVNGYPNNKLKVYSYINPNKEYPGKSLLEDIHNLENKFVVALEKQV